MPGEFLLLTESMSCTESHRTMSFCAYPPPSCLLTLQTLDRNPSSYSLVVASNTKRTSPLSLWDPVNGRSFVSSFTRGVNVCLNGLLDAHDRVRLRDGSVVFLGVFTGFIAYLLAGIAMPTPVSPLVATLPYQRVPTVYEFGGDMSGLPNEVMYKFIVDVLAFGS